MWIIMTSRREVSGREVSGMNGKVKNPQMALLLLFSGW